MGLTVEYPDGYRTIVCLPFSVITETWLLMAAQLIKGSPSELKDSLPPRPEDVMVTPLESP